MTMAETSIGPAETIAERAAKNQSTFRNANERIEEAAEGLGESGLLPFLCECPRPGCTELTQLALSEYEDVRQNGRSFLVAPGHETTHIEGVEIAIVVAKHDRFSVMEKVGEAGEIARQKDPRSNG
jgi:hypothetical protein